jgi:hypothetical protein
VRQEIASVSGLQPIIWAQETMRAEMGKDKDMGKERCKSTDKQRNTSGLRPAWKPGQSGNPNGRPPKGRALAEIYREILDAEEVEFRIWKDGEEKTQMLRGQPTIRHRMGLVLLGMAMSGDISAIREMSDRTEGKVAAANAQIEATATGGDGKDMKVTITVVGSDRDIDV